METAEFRGGRRRRSNSGRLDFVTASVLRWPTRSDESRKSKRRSRRSSGAAHRWRCCTGADGIRRRVEDSDTGSGSHERRRSSGDTATGQGSLDSNCRRKTPGEHGLAQRRLKPANRRRPVRA
jgi:hypothetical protein